ncbi:hypothetical protein DHL47_07595 [Streptococcus panodentis]|uniref:Uncharacterized protein n=1 Tax=Streptococcus panodentis TaxID=1581472 RepID=A0ABS5AX65_9STRE|nr:hypothetical protein [Streptococcus panodentis]
MESKRRTILTHPNGCFIRNLKAMLLLLPLGSSIYNLKSSTGAFEQSATASKVFYQNKARLKDFLYNIFQKMPPSAGEDAAIMGVCLILFISSLQQSFWTVGAR